MSNKAGTLSRLKTPIVPRHVLVAASAWISRIIMAIVQFASIRVLISGLGIEQYAAFALLTALMGWFMLADMGIGFSLQNYISGRRSKSEPYSDYITMAATIAAILLILTILALYLISPYIAPIYLKQFHQITDAEKTRLLFTTGALFIGAALGGISYKIWYAEQKGYFANVFPTVASLLGYAGIIAVNSSSLSDKLLYSLAVFLAPSALIPLGALIVQVTNQLRGGTWAYTTETFYEISKRAINFWLLLLITSLSLQIDYLVISQFLKPEDIVVYNLSTRISWFILFLYISALTALWPVFSEAIAKGNWPMVKELTKNYLAVGLGFTLFSSLLLVWLMPIVVKFLSPHETIVIPVMFILLLGIYQLIRVWTDTFTMILQSMSDLKPLWIAGPCQAILSIFLQWHLAQSIGLYGIILGNVLSFTLTSAWLLPRSVMKHYKKQTA